MSTTAIRIYAGANKALVELREGEAPSVAYSFTPTPDQRAEIATAIAKAAQAQR